MNLSDVMLQADVMQLSVGVDPVIVGVLAALAGDKYHSGAGDEVMQEIAGIEHGEAQL